MLHLIHEIRQRRDDILARLMLLYDSCRNIGRAVGRQHSFVVRAEVPQAAVHEADSELRVSAQRADDLIHRAVVAR